MIEISKDVEFPACDHQLEKHSHVVVLARIEGHELSQTSRMICPDGMGTLQP